MSLKIENLYNKVEFSKLVKGDLFVLASNIPKNSSNNPYYIYQKISNSSEENSVVIRTDSSNIPFSKDFVIPYNILFDTLVVKIEISQIEITAKFI